MPIAYYYNAENRLMNVLEVRDIDRALRSRKTVRDCLESVRIDILDKTDAGTERIFVYKLNPKNRKMLCEKILVGAQIKESMAYKLFEDQSSARAT